MPLLFLLLLGAVQVAVVARDRLAVQLAAREAARAVAIGADPGRARAAALGAVRLEGMRVEVARRGDVVIATVRYADPTDVPFMGALLPDVVVRATVVMAMEPP